MRLTKLLAPFALVLTLLVPAGAATATAAAAKAAPHTSRDGTVTNREDGTVIAFTVFRPGVATPRHRVPMVLHSHGWGGSRTTSIDSFKSFLDAGMGVLSFDQRGFGESTGEANIQDPTKETEDVKAVIDHVAKLPWVRHDADRRGRAIANDPVLAAIGGSYGGGYQTMTALDEVADKGRTRFNALAPEITWYDLPQSLAPNKVVRTAWVTTLFAAGATAVPDYVRRAFVWGAATGQWPDGTVLDQPVPGAVNIDDELHKHGPVYFAERGIRLNIPVLQRQGITDNLFNLNQGLDIFQKALTPAARGQSYLVGYNGGHALPNVLPMGTGGGTLATPGDACSGDDGFANLSIQFFKRVFAGKSTRGLLPGQYNLTTAAQDNCLRGGRFTSKSVPVGLPGVGDVVAVSGAGAPLQLEVATGPASFAGVPRLSGWLTTAGVDGRAFLGLSVGSTPADARVIQNNLMPIRRALPVTGEEFAIDLTAIAVEVPAGQHLYLTIAPMSDLFAGHGSKAPTGWVMSDLHLSLPGLVR
ncbi:MAG: CocE/NonD family hydrolase [Actinobacteria bacterium]|nr:CocE/NonD family hydrolase [Actinomycetota bacterium]